MRTRAVLEKYREHLDRGCLDEDWSALPRPPLSRYHTFLRAFEMFRRAGGKVVVELGTIRSYTHGGLPGCNSDDLTSWTPQSPENWDWGAGSFSRIAAECLEDIEPVIHTVDTASGHIERCVNVTRDFARLFEYHVADSREFLRSFAGRIDLAYLDTGDMTPIEPTARLQLEEAEALVERDLVPEGGLVLLDDVRNQTPRRFGDDSGLGKSKYALPFLLAHEFEIEMDEYQVLLVRRAGRH